jgi:2-C-methyl-D-erythritol 4-phosphate cytidylyltransferase/2-C-methyl-D-erythritol 2,4-cyclodiphosphate synthase
MGSDRNKVLLSLCGRSVIRRSAEAFRGLVDEMTVVYHAPDETLIREEISASALAIPVRFVPGGSSRQESVRNGLNASAAGEDDLILVHDGARCLVKPDTIERVISSVRTRGSGIAGFRVSSTYKACAPDGAILHTVDRGNLAEVQTPQGFRCGLLREAFARAEQDGFIGTDDASVLEHAGIPVFLAEGDRSNIKLTTPADVELAESLLNKEVCRMRIGMGYDVHRFAEGRKLILCGVEIPWERGLLGHSDADVALHALMDALLGACALGDIGRHFPDTDPSLEGISSLNLLEKTRDLSSRAGYVPNNLDVTIVAQKPKLAPYIPSMVETVAETLRMKPVDVNVKATTTEKLGFEGREEGISAYAVCCVRPAGAG